MATKYSIANMPLSADPETAKLIEFLFIELRRLSEVVNNLADGHLEKQTSEPDNPREDMMRFADGIGWNPTGSGTLSARGIYWYNGTSTASFSWIKITDATK